MAPVIKIFTNDSKLEFHTQDELATWLLTALKARGGEYQLKSTDPIADLPVGSIALFRFGTKLIVGEGVVAVEPVRHNPPVDDIYVASVFFRPSSIRVFSPPVKIDDLQAAIGGKGVKDISTVANSYAKLPLESYAKMIATHVANGGGFL